MAIVMKNSSEEERRRARARYDRGPLPEFFFSRNGTGTLSRKAYLDKMGGRPVTNLWPFSETGHTDEASRLLKNIFGGTAVFDTPKPPRLIERILQIVGKKDALVLDSFAGSGTTAHAVLNMNKEDGGNRKFILIELGDYADTVTAERVKRVIKGYGEGKNAVEGTEGNFSFYELGEPILDKDGLLNERVPLQTIRDYVWQTETKSPEPAADDEYYLGTQDSIAYYLFYDKEKTYTLDYRLLSKIREKSERYVIYAGRCALSEEELEKFSITYKQLPKDIIKV